MSESAVGEVTLELTKEEIRHIKEKPPVISDVPCPVCRKVLSKAITAIQKQLTKP